MLSSILHVNSPQLRRCGAWMATAASCGVLLAMWESTAVGCVSRLQGTVSSGLERFTLPAIHTNLPDLPVFERFEDVKSFHKTTRMCFFALFLQFSMGKYLLIAFFQWFYTCVVSVILCPGSERMASKKTDHLKRPTNMSHVVGIVMVSSYLVGSSCTTTILEMQAFLQSPLRILSLQLTHVLKHNIFLKNHFAFLSRSQQPDSYQNAGVMKPHLASHPF